MDLEPLSVQQIRMSAAVLANRHQIMTRSEIIINIHSMLRFLTI